MSTQYCNYVDYHGEKRWRKEVAKEGTSDYDTCWTAASAPHSNVDREADVGVVILVSEKLSSTLPT